MVHRAGAALNLNLHLHAVVLDGAYVDLGPDSPPSFRSLPAELPTSTLHGVARRVRRQLDAILGPPVGRPPHPKHSPPSSATPVITEAASQLASSRAARERPGTRGRLRGVEVHAAPPVAADDRAGLFRLSRYVTRPAFDPGTVSITDGGSVRVPLGRRSASGATHVDLRPEELALRLGALIPEGHANRVSYHGVLAPRAADRWRVVPTQLTLVDEPAPAPRTPRSATAHHPEKPKPVTPEEALTCHGCGTRMAIVGLEEDSD
jgi:hypothetical protein